MNLKPHQVRFAQGYPDKKIVAHEGGTGKTVCACVWLYDGRDRNAFIVCPKRVVTKWRFELSRWGAKATVISKEDFKKNPPKKLSALVVDEADEFASPLFVTGRSKLAETLYELIKENPDMPILLLTATPIRSSPWNLHTELCYIGQYTDWKRWRAKYFSLEVRPFLSHPTWLPRANWRDMIREELEKHADIVLMKDCVDFLPPVTEETIKVQSDPFKADDEWEPSAAFVAEHRHEQKNKAKTIIEISSEYRKVLVVVYYVEQIKELSKILSRDRQTFTVYGGIKDQEKLLLEANKTDECFLICQASIGVGFDADTFPCVIFASMAYGVQRLAQMKWRVRRIYNLQPVRYIYLVAGRCDKAVKASVELGKDFVPALWEPHEHEPS